MTKKILSIASALVLATAGMLAVPRAANAVVWWVAPAIVGSAIVGVGTGAIIADASSRRAYASDNPEGTVRAQGTIYVEPSTCRDMRERYNGRWHRVRVCD